RGKWHHFEIKPLQGKWHHAFNRGSRYLRRAAKPWCMCERAVASDSSPISAISAYERPSQIRSTTTARCRGGKHVTAWATRGAVSFAIMRSSGDGSADTGGNSKDSATGGLWQRAASRHLLAAIAYNQGLNGRGNW